MTDLIMVQEFFWDDDLEPHSTSRGECGWASPEEAVAYWKSHGRKFTPYRNGIEYQEITPGRWRDMPDVSTRTRVWFYVEAANS